MWTFFAAHEATGLTAALVLWVVSGFSVDSLGSYVEFYCIDRPRPDHQQMLDTWWRYLRIAWVQEPIGQHYLRRLLVSFKFELNMFVATLISLVGVPILGFAGSIRWSFATGFGVLLAVAAVLFAKAARASSDVLADVRAALVKGVGEPPFDQSGNPTRPRSS